MAHSSGHGWEPLPAVTSRYRADNLLDAGTHSLTVRPKWPSTGCRGFQCDVDLYERSDSPAKGMRSTTQQSNPCDRPGISGNRKRRRARKGKPFTSPPDLGGFHRWWLLQISDPVRTVVAAGSSTFAPGPDVRFRASAGRFRRAGKKTRGMSGLRHEQACGL